MRKFIKFLKLIFNKLFFSKTIIFSFQRKTKFLHLTPLFQVIFCSWFLISSSFFVYFIGEYFNKYNIHQVAFQNYLLKKANRDILSYLNNLTDDIDTINLHLSKKIKSDIVSSNDKISQLTYSNANTIRSSIQNKIIKMHSAINNKLNTSSKIIKLLGFKNIEEKSTGSLKSQKEKLDMIAHYQNLIEISPIGFPGKNAKITSAYGNRSHPLHGIDKFHNGVDMTLEGGKITSPKDGVVTFVGKKTGFGNCIEISHGDDMITRYAHLEKINIKVGQNIQKGQLIGIAGKTGQATAVHLHYEIRWKGQHLNPNGFLKYKDPD